MPEPGSLGSGMGQAGADAGHSGFGGGSNQPGSGFHPGINPELGPGARGPRSVVQSLIDKSTPTRTQNIFATILSAFLPGASVKAVPDYVLGEPVLETTINPLGLAATFLGGFNPFADVSRKRGFVIGKTPFGKPTHNVNPEEQRDVGADQELISGLFKKQDNSLQLDFPTEAVLKDFMKDVNNFEFDKQSSLKNMLKSMDLSGSPLGNGG